MPGRGQAVYRAQRQGAEVRAVAHRKAHRHRDAERPEEKPRAGAGEGASDALRRTRRLWRPSACTGASAAPATPASAVATMTALRATLSAGEAALDSATAISADETVALKLEQQRAETAKAQQAQVALGEPHLQVDFATGLFEQPVAFSRGDCGNPLFFGSDFLGTTPLQRFELARQGLQLAFDLRQLRGRQRGGGRRGWLGWGARELRSAIGRGR